jgi:histidyl-tRNA synthetase
VVTGRRSGHEILHRLRRKWDLSHSLLGVLERMKEQVHDLADLKGPPGAVIQILKKEYASLAPDSVAALKTLVEALADYGVDLDRVELDLGFGRGIGFYSQMIFEIIAPTAEGPIEVCGGGRYDGLARVFGSARDDRGVGFACGLERLMHALEMQQYRPAAKPGAKGCLVAAKDQEASVAATGLVTTLRNLNDGTWLDDGPIIVITDTRLEAAKAFAQARNLATIIYVQGSRERIQLDWQNGTWVEVSTEADS